MVDTVRTLDQILTLLADNTTGTNIVLTSVKVNILLMVTEFETI